MKKDERNMTVKEYLEYLLSIGWTKEDIIEMHRVSMNNGGEWSRHDAVNKLTITEIDYILKGLTNIPSFFKHEIEAMDSFISTSGSLDVAVTHFYKVKESDYVWNVKENICLNYISVEMFKSYVDGKFTIIDTEDDYTFDTTVEHTKEKVDGGVKWKDVRNSDVVDGLKKEDYEMLIDAALIFGDREWFNELSGKMNSLQFS